MRRLFIPPTLAVIIFFLAFSCAEKQDFNQFDDLSITPTVASSLFYLESEEQHINAVGDLNNFYSQIVNFEAFNEQFVAENLLEGTITYEIENTTSKELSITIEFLDETGNVLDAQVFDVDPTPAPLFSLEVFYGPGGKNIDILTTTSALRISANNLGDSTSVSTLPEPKLILRSAGEFTFRLK
ncbi:hypothetical protein [Flagellimonas sp. S3867]|uniref:hypothetical protein n=1 Tax=Flagellimonas sp. S3867 TaxID=2768063 RepID=UPI0016878C9F|nr:hypothetical protein [Flagellimonas sp. S3867]